MTDPRAYLADVLAKAAPGGITGEGGPYSAVYSEWHPLVENADGELACMADNFEQAEHLALVLNASPAMARALIAVLDLLDKPMYEGDLPAVVDAIRAAITTELAKEIEHD